MQDLSIREITAFRKYNESNVTVVGDDTNLLVLLAHMIKDSVDNQLKLLLSTKTCVYDVYDIKATGCSNNEIMSSILLLHSFTGCDTTSRILGVG